MQGYRSDLTPFAVRMAAVSFVVDEVLGGMDAAVAELRAGHLEKAFLVEKLKPWRNSPVILENDAYILWHNSAQAAFGTRNGRSNLIDAVLAQVNQFSSPELESTSSGVAAAVEDRTMASVSTDRKNKRKLITEDYATKEQLSILEDLRVQRADLHAKPDIVKEEEEALMAELVQTAAAECGDPEPPQKCEEITGRAGITSSSLASLFAARGRLMHQCKA